MSTQDSVTHNNTTCRSGKELSTTCSFKKRPICNCAVAVSLSSHCRRSFDFCFESNSKFLSTILRLSFVKHSQNFLFPKTTKKKRKWCKIQSRRRDSIRLWTSFSTLPIPNPPGTISNFYFSKLQFVWFIVLIFNFAKTSVSDSDRLIIYVHNIQSKSKFAISYCTFIFIYIIFCIFFLIFKSFQFCMFFSVRVCSVSNFE